MSNIIVIVFDNMIEAEMAKDALRERQKEGQLKLDDWALVIKDKGGELDVQQVTDSGVKTGAGIGGMLGLFIGLMLAAPIANLLIGALGGAAIGSLARVGVDKKFLEEITEVMKPGSSALFLMVGPAEAAPSLAALKPFKGQVYHTTLTAEAQENLQRVLSKRT